MTRKGTTTERGYGYDHQRARSVMQDRIARGVVYCTLCPRPIYPGELWDLDHKPDRTGYRGAAHRSCNRRDGARRGNAKRRIVRAVRRVSRRW